MMADVNRATLMVVLLGGVSIGAFLLTLLVARLHRPADTQCCWPRRVAGAMATAYASAGRGLRSSSASSPRL
jgi:hypothetical protein